jgi:predicted nucleic acid-binding protein
MNDQGSRPKIYLDTSVPSHLFDTDALLQTVDTWRLWAAIRGGEYDACISSAVMDELKKTPEPKLRRIIREIGAAGIEELSISDEVIRLTEEYIGAGVLGGAHRLDCLHIAFATISGCGTLVSWNFQHLAKAGTTSKVAPVNTQNKYSAVAIESPATLVARRDAL